VPCPFQVSVVVVVRNRDRYYKEGPRSDSCIRVNETTFGRSNFTVCCCSSSVEDEPPIKIDSYCTNRSFLLSSEDLRRVLSSWKSILHKDVLINRILKNILLSSDNIRQVFRLHMCSVEDLDRHPRFERHCKSLLLFMNIIILKLKTGPNKLIDLTQEVGQKHVSFREVVFDAEYWLTFKRAIHEDEKDRQLTKEAWNRLMTFLILEIKDAFLKHIQVRGPGFGDKLMQMDLLQETLQQELNGSHQILRSLSIA
ncbi:unnamed protein product, partial [Soboliphyme baturini]|uniref:GLOBIN domain-containing protein n=1 Tax=Soboliphyme baturini TaxID=241478 RepID=A0A183IZ38_9BILA